MVVMGWWDLDMNHQGSMGLGLRQGTQDDVLGLAFGQPKGEKSSWAVISEKVKKGQFCALSLQLLVPVSPGQLGLSFSINKESSGQIMARNSLGKALPKSYQKDKERETGG